MTPEQVQFCYNIAQGRYEAADTCPFLLKIPLPYEIFKQSNFELYPILFCLWAYKQDDPAIIIEKLQQLYPKVSLPMEFKPGSIQSIRETIYQSIFPLAKHALISLLQNISKLTFTNDSQYQNVIFSFEVLNLILTDGYFEDSRQRNDLMKLANLIHQNLKLSLNTAKFQHHSITEVRNTPKKEMPDTVKSLLEHGRTFLPSGGMKKKSATSYLPLPTCREEEVKEKYRRLVMQPVH